MANLRDEILKLTNPAPVFIDPEDNSDDETSAKVVDQGIDEYEEITQPSKLRQKTAIILADSDRRYAGKKTSRKNLSSDVTDDSGEESGNSDDDDDEVGSDGSDKNSLDDDDSDDIDEEDDENVMDVGGVDEEFNKKFSKFGTKEFEFKDDGDYAKYADDVDEDSGDDSDDQQNDDDDISEDEDSGKGDEGLSDDDDDGDDDMGDEEIDSEDEGIQKFSSAATDEVAKGQAAKQQLGLWDTLLEGRIKLQKAVSIVNQLPQKEAWRDFSETSETFEEEAGKAQQALGHLLGSLVHLQDILLHQNAETRNILEGKQANTKKHTVPEDDDDEEIPSDTDEEMDKQDDKPMSTTTVRKRKLKFDEYPDVLKKRHCSFQEYRNATIQKWYDKTRLAAGKVKGKSFSAFDQSAVVQINQILADKERLIKRTQLKRTVYRVLGTKPTPDQPRYCLHCREKSVCQTETIADNDVEIFDDDDFYHQLLRELIEKKTSDVSDPVALSRQWLEIQKLRSKNKKKVDNRASKGRKVRYDVHKKLVNFMAPVDNCKWSHEARDDLFKSLFGKRFSTNQV
ncbi:LOW QUALITY PROTEIN: protein AATF-like [Mercenaria mercenaria]|uniref:LOW QUALITY PROTEIN: protein AATF-like n=1 Tax=Mercenaria mercenaria TaxID=6596 RepID=UPI00234F18C1|nr:LOW QUALITY PROTEIN: protein AATF-like [Mercenaria mercenaria]